MSTATRPTADMRGADHRRVAPVEVKITRLYAIGPDAGLVGKAVLRDGVWRCTLFVEGEPHQIARQLQTPSRKIAEEYICGDVAGARVTEVRA